MGALSLTSPPARIAARIQPLPPEVVERIAAGEVVERPVSVVRELVDNALDAGAGEVRVDVRGGGLRLIRVTDDGCGIPAEAVELAVRHHTTSKIRCADDLYDVRSLGFRGEALPAIAGVSELTILTAAEAAMVGVRLETRFGTAFAWTAAPRSHGTTVTVRNLFGNMPVRLKFIGGARAESAQISALLRRYALAHPGVRFRLTLDGHPSLTTSGKGLEVALREVFGTAVGGAMRAIAPVQVGAAVWSGHLSARHVTRSSRRHITIAVNGRCVANRALLAALEESYRSLLPRGRHPIAVLALELPRAHLDVNVHPGKAEVRIHDEGVIAGALKTVVQQTLGRAVDGPPADLSFALGARQLELPRAVSERGPEYDLATGARLRAMRVIGQVRGSLILVEDEGGLYLIDQHRAHERAIYELLLRRHAEGRAGQMLLEPLHIELDSAQMARLEPRLPELAALGFVCEWFGGRSFLIRSVPVIPETHDLAGTVEDLIDLATHDDTDWRHRLLTSVACRSATRRGRSLTVEQCRELVHLLADTTAPAACPHGSPVILQFSGSFLERQFDW